MAAAILYPETAQGKATSSKIEGLASGYISMARTIYHNAPDLVDGVMVGAIALDAAYQEGGMKRNSPPGGGSA